mgnify:CR=1 FL=1
MPRTLRTALNTLAAALLLAAVTAQAQTTPAAESAPAAGAGTAPQAAATAAADADPDAHFKGKMGGTFGKNIIDVLPSAKRVAVPAFRLAFITNNAVTAQVRGSYLPGRDSSGARSSLHLALKGVDAAALQAITDKAYAQLLDQLRQSGREVVPVEEMKEFFGTVNPTESTAAKPYSKEQNGQTASIFAPTGMPLVFTHFDQWGDRGSFDLNNYRRLGEFSHKWNAAVIAPLVIVNFARMSSSGNTSGLTSRTAETGAELAMSVAGYNSYYARSEEFRNNVVMKGDEGSFNMAFLRFLDLLLAFLCSAQAIAEEVEARTVGYLLVRPAPRGAIVLGKLLAGYGIVLSVLTLCFAALAIASVFAAGTPADILPAHHAHEARSAKLVDTLSARWRVQREVAELARAVAAEHGNLGKLKEMRPATVHDVLMRCDAIRRPERFVHMLDACEADKSSRRAVGLPESAGEPFVARADAMAALAAMQSVDAGAIAARLATAGKPERIAAEVRDARIAAIRDRRDAAS